MVIKLKNKKWIGLLTLAVFFVPLAVFALPTPIPPIAGSGITLDELEDLITGIARFLIIVSVIIAVIFIIWGGIRWISARGSDDAIKAARSTIINGIIGALIVLGVGVILQTLAGVVSRSIFGTFQ